MEPVRDILIKVEQAYRDRITLKSGLNIYLSQNIKQVKDTIRYGKVIAVPGSCPIDVHPGDILFFHHNIVATTVMEDHIPDMESSFLVDKENGIYRVPIDDHWPLAYAVLRDDELIALDGVCFVRPVKQKKYDTFLEIPNNEREVEFVGDMVYSNQYLRNLGVEEGTRIIYSKDSEYAFDINGETLYCMFDRWILGIYE